MKCLFAGLSGCFMSMQMSRRTREDLLLTAVTSGAVRDPCLIEFQRDVQERRLQSALESTAPTPEFKLALLFITLNSRCWFIKFYQYSNIVCYLIGFSCLTQKSIMFMFFLSRVNMCKYLTFRSQIKIIKWGI